MFCLELFLLASIFSIAIEMPSSVKSMSYLPAPLCFLRSSAHFNFLKYLQRLLYFDFLLAAIKSKNKQIAKEQ